MEAPQIPGLQHILLPTKPTCPISYTFTQLQSNPSTPNTIWLIFINGLGLPQAFWQPTLQLLQQELVSTTNPSPSPANIFATTYDRYGQGLTRPQDNSPPTPHDITDSIVDLTTLIPLLHQHHLPTLPQSKLNLILIAHSIGVPLTRLFLSSSPLSYPIKATLFLDSNLANTDMTALLPDPSSPSFDPTTMLPPNTTTDDLLQARTNYTRLFAPSAPNPENLDRTTLLTLLPHADAPALPAGVKLTVVAHDPATFAEESLKIAARGLTEQFIEPAWRDYNLGLLKLSAEGGGAERIVVARGAGHFVQRDNPRCVADEIWALIGRVEM